MSLLAFIEELEAVVEQSQIKNEILTTYDGFDPSEKDIGTGSFLSPNYCHQTVKVNSGVLYQVDQGNQGIAVHQLPTNLTNNYAALFAGHCKRCGDYLQPDGSCNLCRQPLPF